MNPRLEKHLKAFDLDEKFYKTMTRLIKALLRTCDNADQLLSKIADKCYRSEKDRKLAKVQARQFIMAVFGGVDAVFKYGPEVAVGIMLKEQYPPSADDKKETLVKVEKIQKKNSVKFSALLHEPEEDIVKHPMWTRTLNQYLLGPTLGVGGTSKVKLAYDPKTKTKVAMKILKPKYANSADKEINILKKLNHKNIVKVYDCFSNVLYEEKRTTIFAVEYANQGELIEYLMYTSKFEDDLARWFFHNLTEGVGYCHSEKIIHRDLKHDNCLLGDNFVLKITDFGFATYCNENEMMNTAIGTAQYAAPEILKGREYTSAVDIFSMGVMLFIALAGSQPWRRADAKRDKWYKMVHKGDWENFFKYHQRSHKFTANQKTILKGLLEPNPEDRWKLNDIKRSKWLNGNKISQDEAAMRLQKRKRIVDRKKFKEMKPGVQKTRKAVGIFSDRRPYVYFQPTPCLSFVTCKRPQWVLEDIANVIENMKGITNEDKEKFKLSFFVTKLVDTGRYLNKKTKEKEYEKVRVCGTVQMWTQPGQRLAFEDKEKICRTIAEGKDSMSEGAKDGVSKNIPAIRSIAVFRPEGGFETKFLFPGIYSDILEALPADVISLEVFDEDAKEDEDFDCM